MVKLAVFSDLYGRVLTQGDPEPEEISEICRDTQEADPELLPMIKLGTFGSLQSPPTPGILNSGGSLRWEGNLLTVSGVEGDHDAGTLRFDEAVSRLETADIAFMMYTTKRHTDALHRWRVLAWFAKEYPPSERIRYARILNGILGGELAPESAVTAQCYYAGGVNGPPALVHFGTSDRCLDEADLDAQAMPFKPVRPQPRQTTGTGGATGPGGTGGTGTSGKPPEPDWESLTEQELKDVLDLGVYYFRPCKYLLPMWFKRGMSEADAVANLTALFDSIPQANRRKKWAGEKAKIPKWVQACWARLTKAQRRAAFVALVNHVAGEPHYHRAILTNTFSGRIEVSTTWPPKPGVAVTDWREMVDGDVLELLHDFQASGLEFARKTTVFDVMMLFAGRNQRHPPREYLESRKGKWNKIRRVPRLFIDYFPALEELPKNASKVDIKHHDELRKYLEETATCFMVGLVARIMVPGAKVDCLPAILGPQSFDKSKALAALLPDPSWFSDDLATSLGDRDAKESLQGKMLIELSEFPHARKDQDKVKAFFSRQNDRYRKAYGYFSADYPRQCGFVATANGLEFIDVTGNRRVWPVALTKPAVVQAIIRDRDQLWAEALHLYNQRYQWWLPPDLEVIAGDFQDAYVEHDIWDELILEYLDRDFPPDKKTGEREPFTVKQALRGLGFTVESPSALTYPKPADEKRAIRRLRRLGYEPNPHRTRANGQARLWVAVRKRVAA